MPSGTRDYLTVTCALMCGLWLHQPSFAGEREDAVAFLATTLKCPVPNEKRRDKDGMFHIIKSQNEFRGNASSWSLRESFTDTWGMTGGEMYAEKQYIDVAFKFSDIEAVLPNGTKATIKCRSGKSCMNVLYVSSPDAGPPSASCFEPGMCREETRKRKSSYRVSTCSNQAAHDVKDVVEFLAGLGGGK